MTLLRARHRAETLAAPWVAGDLAGRIAYAKLTQPLAERLARFGQLRDAELHLRAAWPRDGACLLAETSRHAEAMLVPFGDHWRLREEAPPSEILDWRALTQRLPAGLWVAAAARGFAPAAEVRLLTPDMAPVHPTAHLHLHASAVCPFEVLWTALMVREPPEFAQAACRAGAASAEAAWQWRALVATLRVVRVLLHDCLHRDARSLSEAIDGLPGDMERRCIITAVERLIRGRPVVDDRRDVRALVRRAREVVAGRSGVVSSAWAPRRVEEVWRADPVAVAGGAWPEGHLMSQGFARLSAGSDELARRVFIAYLRARIRLYQYIVTDPTQPGLVEFARDFVRADPYLVGLDLLAPAVASTNPALRLAAVELRGTPRAVAAWARRPEKLPRTDGVELGLVVHFVREKRDRTPAQRIRRLLGEGRRLGRLLAAQPEASRLIRGVDIAGDERAGMAWQALPTLRAVRRVGFENARRHGTPPLRVTLHAGEDFHHLLGGLRAIDQPRAWGLLGRGDRLGHALALGLSSTQWAERVSLCRVPCLERFLDLVWAAEQLLELGEPPGGASEHVRAELRMVSEALVGMPVAKDEGVAFVNGCLGSADWVEARARMSPFEAMQSGTRLERFVGAWLHGEPSATQRANAVVEVATAREVALVEHVQRGVARRLARLGVVVELNPSSNLTVAGLGRLVDQPVFRLLPWDRAEVEKQVVPAVTISADDPLQFATDLSDEMAYAWAAMVDAGATPSEASMWLEQVAVNGWRGRFTVG